VSLVARLIGLTLEYTKLWDAKVSNAKQVMLSNSVCFWLSDRAIRWYSHLARPCEVFHKWVGKTCGMIYDRSHDVRPESCLLTRVRHMTRVASSNRSQAYDQCRILWPESGIQLESRLLTGVGHMTRVASSNRSWEYDRSHIFRPESHILPKSRLSTGVKHTTGVGHMTGVAHTTGVRICLHYKQV
jgi:hypothetical protein